MKLMMNNKESLIGSGALEICNLIKYRTDAQKILKNREITKKENFIARTLFILPGYFGRTSGKFYAFNIFSVFVPL